MDLQINELSDQMLLIIAIALVWELVWKGLALWRAGRLNQPVWFVILLVINTLGIAPILYLLLRKKNTQTE